jgi:hypothetical protein
MAATAVIRAEPCVWLMTKLTAASYGRFGLWLVVGW